MDYTFKRFDDLRGFNNPIDVFFGDLHLGTLETKPDGFCIKVIDTPNGNQFIKETYNNKFKTELDAARKLHRIWIHLWSQDDDGNDNEGEEWKK